MTPAALVLASLAVVSATSTAVAQQARFAGDTITVVQRVLLTANMTPAAARRAALERGLADAVRQVGGVRVQASQLGIDDDRNGRVQERFLSVVQLDAAGRAVDYRVLDERFVTERHAALGNQLYLELRALVTVAAEHGAADPSFTVDAALNDAVFVDRGGSVEENDEVVATISSSRDAWLTVFSVAGDSAELLVPNALMPGERVGAGGRVELPSAAWRDRGLHFRAALTPDERDRRELLVVVATRDRTTPPGLSPSAGSGVGPRLSLMAMQRWLVGIPLDRRAMAFVAYEVRRR